MTNMTELARSAHEFELRTRHWVSPAEMFPGKWGILFRGVLVSKLYRSEKAAETAMESRIQQMLAT